MPFEDLFSRGVHGRYAYNIHVSTEGLKVFLLGMGRWCLCILVYGMIFPSAGRLKEELGGTDSTVKRALVFVSQHPNITRTRFKPSSARMFSMLCN